MAATNTFNEPAQIRRVQLRDHATVVAEWGTGDGLPTVFIHAALLDHQMWQPTVSHLLRLDAGPPAPIYAYDLRGHGTASGAAPITGVDQLAADLADVIAALGHPQVNLVGVSFGGAVAQRFTVDYPHHVRSLALIATAASFPRSPMMARAASLTDQDRDQVVATTLDRWFGPAAQRAQPVVDYAMDHLNEVSPEHWAATWSALAGFDIGAAADAVSVPVLAVAGGDDVSTPPTVVRELAGLYRRASYVEIPGAAHLVPLVQPAALAHRLMGIVA
ncbi:alpha/beta fold hydrolase [Phytoactinopolyspora limicola]|uniref:alpha/beta fold hydrolase n=1 Tax=Phytoactinopolyspora limicola TaxID=2715536 RepID=UPI001407E1D1|nr:alpha/beta hydrolase [Phytoactinopolyspora limicola]